MYNNYIAFQYVTKIFFMDSMYYFLIAYSLKVHGIAITPINFAFVLWIIIIV